MVPHSFCIVNEQINKIEYPKKKKCLPFTRNFAFFKSKSCQVIYRFRKQKTFENTVPGTRREAWRKSWSWSSAFLENRRLKLPREDLQKRRTDLGKLLVKQSCIGNRNGDALSELDTKRPAFVRTVLLVPWKPETVRTQDGAESIDIILFPCDTSRERARDECKKRF